LFLGAKREFEQNFFLPASLNIDVKKAASLLNLLFMSQQKKIFILEPHQIACDLSYFT